MRNPALVAGLSCAAAAVSIDGDLTRLEIACVGCGSSSNVSFDIDAQGESDEQLCWQFVAYRELVGNGWFQVGAKSE